MAKHEDAKIRLLAVENILRRGDRVTASQILRELDLRFGIQANRKTIYSDVYAINRFLPVDAIPGRGGYQIVDVLGGCEDGK